MGSLVNGREQKKLGINISPGSAICQRRNVQVHAQEDQSVAQDKGPRLRPDIRMRPRVPRCRSQRGCVRDRELDRLGDDEVKDGTSNKSGGKMCGEVVVKEQLSAHEEEWEVMEGPSNDEESSVVDETVSDI